MVLSLCIALGPGTAAAHDPSAWGGLFRTRDAGATWLGVNSGGFVSGAIGLAISPTSPSHLLLATDSGVLTSRNGGRDWTVEAPDVLVGAAFAVTYDADGSRALVSGAAAIFRSDGDRWRAIDAPSGAAPARAFARGSAPGRVYLAGWSGFHASDDWGMSWTDASDGLPGDPVEAVLVDRGPPEVVHAIAGGRLWSSMDGRRRWRSPPGGPSSGRAEAMALDDSGPRRLWALIGGRLWRSDDRGERWLPVGQPLPDPRPVVRGLAIVGPVILLATDRGLYRSPDGGERWEAESQGLPAHLEAGPLVRDPMNPSTIYAGFAFTSYAELWRQAAEGRSALSRLSATNLAGAAAFLGLVLLLAIAVLRRLKTSYDRLPLDNPSASAAAPGAGRGHRP